MNSHVNTHPPYERAGRLHGLISTTSQNINQNYYTRGMPATAVRTVNIHWLGWIEGVYSSCDSSDPGVFPRSERACPAARRMPA